MDETPSRVAPVRTLILVGSVRPGSRTLCAARHAASVVTEGGNEALLWDLRRLPLPIADASYHHNPGEHPDRTVRSLVAAAKRADGFLLCSPVYHNSYSGVLKNALDCLAIEHFRDKPVGLIVHGPNLTAVQACDHLRIVARGLYGLCVPEQVVTTPDDFGAGEDGGSELVGASARQRVEDLVHAVVKLGRR